MKSLNNIIENFFSNVGARPMTLREFIINLLNSETSGSPASDALSDNRLIDDFLDRMLEDDFHYSRKIKGINIDKFLLKNMDKYILINAEIINDSFRKSSRPVYSYNLTVDGEEFIKKDVLITGKPQVIDGGTGWQISVGTHDRETEGKLP